jgi:hypothetical protein
MIYDEQWIVKGVLREITKDHSQDSARCKSEALSLKPAYSLIHDDDQ